MEVIKKKICLEDFICRIPGLFKCSSDLDSTNGSWGKFPNIITYSEYKDGEEYKKLEMRYGTLMDIYYTLLNVLMNSTYYEYEHPDGKNSGRWLKRKYDWREIYEYGISNKNKVRYVTKLPGSLTEKYDRMIYGITSESGETMFNDFSITLIADNGDEEKDGFEVIRKINNIIGKEITPSSFNGIFVPYFIYLVDVPDMLTFMEGLRDSSTKNCCNIKEYDEYGGDDFIEYLNGLKEKYESYEQKNYSVNTIDIPLLLTSKLVDIGQYKSYNVDVIENGTYVNEASSVINETTNKIVKTSSESKFKTLRKDRIGIDDNCNELPGIIEYKKPSDADNNNTKTVLTLPNVVDNTKKYLYYDGKYYEWNNNTDYGMYVPCISNMLLFPYKIGYIKNTSVINDVTYGDSIVSITYTPNPIDVKESEYNDFVSKLNKFGLSDSILDGTVGKPLKNVTINGKTYTSKIDGYYSKEVEYGNASTGYSEERVMEYYINETKSLKNELIIQLVKFFKKIYPTYKALKQEYRYDFTLIYGELDESGVIVEKQKKISTSDYVYIYSEDDEMEVIYVIGGQCKYDGTKLIINESSPFSATNNWTGFGIWYKETFPVKKYNISELFINGMKKELMYDVIDFASKEVTYQFDGIDFPRKNYILCENVMYEGDKYKSNSTNDVIFRDERMLGLNFPLKEKYDVYISRGTSSAFERHLQLSDIKTCEDFEKYRNGMFLNK